jgi:hypothetical protein
MVEARLIGWFVVVVVWIDFGFVPELVGENFWDSSNDLVHG